MERQARLAVSQFVVFTEEPSSSQLSSLTSSLFVALPGSLLISAPSTLQTHLLVPPLFCTWGLCPILSCPAQWVGSQFNQLTYAEF